MNEPKPRELQTGKAGRIREADVAAIRGLAVDLDPVEAEERQAGGFDAERARLFEKARSLLADAELPASAVIDSGGGVQALWLFPEALPADDAVKAAVRERGRALCHAMGAGSDRVHSLDHLFRIPFTANIPNAKKREKGRQQTVSRLLGENDARPMLAEIDARFPAPPDGRGGGVGGVAPSDDRLEAVRAALHMPTVLDAAVDPETLDPDLRDVFEAVNASQAAASLRRAFENDGKRHPKDFGFACLVVEHGLTDPTDVAAVAFALSPEKLLAKEDGSESGGSRDYAGRTVLKALERAEAKSPQAYFSPIEGEASGAEDVQSRQPGRAPVQFEPTPFRWKDPATLPRRDWVYGNHYMRRYVSATIAPGAVGKSSLVITEALAMASGKPLLGILPRGRFRVWLWNGEDDKDELQRRVTAAMIQHELTPQDVEGYLFQDSGRDTEIVLAKQMPNGAMVQQPVSAALVAALRRDRIDVLVIDPFVSSHELPENDNAAMDRVVKGWARVAEQANCAVELVHHSRKTNGAETTIEDSRGGGAFMAGVRSGRALNRMTKEEAAKLGVPEDVRRTVVRFNADVKRNFSPPVSEETEWYQIRNVVLADSEGVGAVVRWSPVEHSRTTEDTDLFHRIAERIKEGAWRHDVRAGDWVGNAVAEIAGLDAADDRCAINGILSRMKAGGLIRTVNRLDEKRKRRAFVEVGSAHTPPPARDTEGASQ